MRIAPRVVAPETDGLQVVADALVANRPLTPAVGLVALGQEAFADDVTDRHSWVQRSVRILEDDLHAASHLLQVVALKGQDILAVHRDGAAVAVSSRRLSARKWSCRSLTPLPGRTSRRDRSAG